MNSLDLNEVIKKVESPHLVRSSKFLDQEYDFYLASGNHTWNVRLKFDNSFPYKLPSVTLLNKDLIGIMPHVNISGTVCISEGDSILIDYSQPATLVGYVLDQAVELLKKGSLKVYQDELTDEFEGYFESSIARVNSFYEALDETETIYLKVVKPTSNNKDNYVLPFLLYGGKADSPEHFSNLNSTGKNQTRKAIHISLSEPLLPPKKQEQISLGYVLEALKYLSEKNKKILKKLIKPEQKTRQCFVLLSLPRSQGERSQILLDFRAQNQIEHPLLSRSASQWKTTQYLLQRHNSSYLLERGGSNLKLSGKRVAIIGCGSVGGEVAYMLGKAGVGNLTLVDFDILSTDNIYRHRLGGGYLNYQPLPKNGAVLPHYKVNALAQSIKNDLPHLSVIAKPCDFDTALNDGIFGNIDIVIIAVGNPSLSLYINRELKSINTDKAIFCWNEAAGIGGHSITLNLNMSCYECLFTAESGFTHACELQLMQPGQMITKNLTGCAGVFTPFSYLDSSQTATLAAEQCIEVLLGGEIGYALSWKGNNSANLKTTNRYKDMALKEKVSLMGKSNCRRCHES